jgi:PHD/YefM family antitoxin component YafN of YafNO toxin-antitoxin module
MDVATNRTRYVVTSHRRPLVAVVPLEDLERLDDVDRCYELLGDAAYVDGERVTLPEALAGLVNVASKLMEVKP